MLKEPGACSQVERREFARLVCQGFDPVLETLDGRIRKARCLAFYYVADDVLGAVAALKTPSATNRRERFRRANVPVSADEYSLELGWVFVAPSHRSNRIASTLCRKLLELVPTTPVLASTRVNNTFMMRILVALGFARVGTPYPRRNEQLVLYLRPSQGEQT